MLTVSLSSDVRKGFTKHGRRYRTGTGLAILAFFARLLSAAGRRRGLHSVAGCSRGRRQSAVVPALARCGKATPDRRRGARHRRQRAWLARADRAAAARDAATTQGRRAAARAGNGRSLSLQDQGRRAGGGTPA